jgi:SAM-dependent methyltransferase
VAAQSDASTLTYYSFARQEMTRFVAPDCRRILDVGCGTGAFGEGLKKERAVEVWGVEPVPEAAKAATGKLDRVVAAPFTAETELPLGYFDAVIFNDSLEHFPDPFPPLAAARRFLAPGGVVVASIPNVRYIDNVRHFLLEMDWRYEASGIRDRTHLRFFTRKSILRTFAEARYRIETIEGINSHYWSGKKIFLVRLFLRRWVDDMRYMHYAVVARPEA